MKDSIDFGSMDISMLFRKLLVLRYWEWYSQLYSLLQTAYS